MYLPPGGPAPDGNNGNTGLASAGRRPEGAHPLLGALTHHLQVAGIQAQVLIFDTGRFRYPRTRIQEKGYQEGVRVQPTENLAYLLWGQGLYQEFGLLGRPDMLKQVARGVPPLS